MSTLTNNLGLIKPELTDPANITDNNQNWDIVDEQFGKRNIKSYTKLEQLGLSDAEMSSTDFANNIKKIVGTFNGATTVAINISDGVNRTLYNSLIKKLNNDTGITFNTTTNNAWLSIRHNGNYRAPIIIEVCLKSEKHSDKIWTCFCNDEAGYKTLTEFRTTAPMGVDITGKSPFDFDYFMAIRLDENGNVAKSLLFTIQASDYDSLNLIASAAEVTTFAGNQLCVLQHDIRFYWGDGFKMDCVCVEFNVSTGNRIVNNENWTQILGFNVIRN